MTNRRDPTRYERGILQVANTNRHVESVFDEIDKTVVQNEFDIQPWMPPHEFADGRRETEDGVVIRSHFMSAGPSARGIDLHFFQHRNPAHSARQNLLHEAAVEVGFESRRFFGIVQGQQQS